MYSSFYHTVIYYVDQVFVLFCSAMHVSPSSTTVCLWCVGVFFVFKKVIFRQGKGWIFQAIYSLMWGFNKFALFVFFFHRIQWQCIWYFCSFCVFFIFYFLYIFYFFALWPPPQPCFHFSPVPIRLHNAPPCLNFHPVQPMCSCATHRRRERTYGVWS